METCGTCFIQYSLFSSSAECAHAIDLAVLCMYLCNDLLQSCFMHRLLILLQSSSAITLLEVPSKVTHRNPPL